MENNTSVVIEQQDENKKRGALAVILAIAFVAILGIGSTFAYLAYTGNQTPNRFTTDIGLSVDLLEPQWTSAVMNDDGSWKEADGTTTNVASDGTTVIPNAANNMTTSSSVAKDPFVVNTSNKGNETTGGTKCWAGIKLTFQKWVADEISGDATWDPTRTDGLENHTETGKYVDMSADEVKALLAVYGLNATGKSAVGINIGSGWEGTSSSAKVTYGTSNFASTMYFIYGTSLDPVTSTNAESPTAGQSYSTTALFDKVDFVSSDNTTIKALNTVLKAGDASKTDSTNATSDPGWRVVVAAAAVDASTQTSINGQVRADLVAALDASTMTDGAAKVQDGRSAGKGSGVRSSFTVAEDTWAY